MSAAGTGGGGAGGPLRRLAWTLGGALGGLVAMVLILLGGVAVVAGLLHLLEDPLGAGAGMGASGLGLGAVLIAGGWALLSWSRRPLR